MIRTPATSDLVAYVCDLQPELDPESATRILTLDPELQAVVAESWMRQRSIAASLLELHLGLEGMPA